MRSECDVYVLAAMWRKRLPRLCKERDLEEWQELQKWLARAPRNRQAFEQIDVAKQVYEEARNHPRVRTWRQQALARGRRPRFHNPWLQATAAVLVLGVGISIGWALKNPAVTVRGDVLIFNDTTLAKAIGEINSRSLTPVVLADPSLANLRVSGVFVLDRADGFLDGLKTHYPVTVSNDNGRIVLTRRDVRSL